MKLTFKQKGCWLVGGLYLATIICTVVLYCSFKDEVDNRQINTNEQKVERTKEKRDEIKLKEYELHVTLYQFYLKLALDAITFFYLLTGGILAYSLTNYKESPRMRIFLFGDKFPIVKLSLLVPILLSGVFGCLFIYGAKKWYALVDRIGAFRNFLDIDKVPDIQMLSQILLVFGGIFFLVGIVLIIFLFVDLDKPANS